MLSGCYFSDGGIRMFNSGVWFGETPSTVSVRKGDTLYSISRRYNVPLKNLIEANNLRPPYNLNVGQNLRLPAAQYHIVKKGDTLYSIAREHNVDVASLTRKNNLEAPYTLYVGQKLALSGSVSGSSYKQASTKSSTTSKASTTTKRAVQTSNYTPPKNRTAKFMWPVKGTVISGFGVIGKGRKKLRQIFARIDGFFAGANLKMELRTVNAAGASDRGDFFAFNHFLPFAHQKFFIMGVCCYPSIGVFN